MLKVVVVSEHEGGLAEALERAGIAVAARVAAADAVQIAVESAAAAIVVAPGAARLLAAAGTVDRGPPVALSRRELDVLRLVADGKENVEIARELVISPKTVKNHVSRILAKLGLANRVQAAVYAVRHGLERP